MDHRFFPGAFRPWGLVMGFCVEALFALAPPSAGEVEALRKSGEFTNRLAFAKNLGNHLARPREGMPAGRSGARGLVADPGVASVAPPLAWAGAMRSIGTNRILILCVDFPDYPHSEASNSLLQMSNRIFGDGDSLSYPFESLRNYYTRSSFGKLVLEGNVLGWYRSSLPRSSIPMTRSGARNLIAEALNHYDGFGHDFTQYDNDQDGKVDYLAVIWTGPAGEWASFWWAYQTRFRPSDPGLTLDGKVFDNYIWQYASRDGSIERYDPRVLIHETGHMLGLPDLYDYQGGVGPDGGVGGWDVMHGNICDHNGFSKYVLGWVTPLVCTNSTFSVKISHSGGGVGNIATILTPDWSADLGPFQEYFLVENRINFSNDAIMMPTNGLTIWHVDARLRADGRDTLCDNSYTSHKLLRLLEADGLERIEKKLPTSDFQFHPGGRFGPTTSPDSRFHGEPRGVMGIRSISNGTNHPFSHMDRYFDVVRVGGAAPSLTLTHPGPRAVNLQWSPSGSATPTGYRVQYGVGSRIFIDLTNFGPDVFTLALSGMDASNAYAYRVFEYFGSEEGLPSAIATRRVLSLEWVKARTNAAGNRMELGFNPRISGPVTPELRLSYRPNGSSSWVHTASGELTRLTAGAWGANSMAWTLPETLAHRPILEWQAYLSDDVTVSDPVALDPLDLSVFFRQGQDLGKATVTGNPYRGTDPVGFVNLPPRAKIRILHPDGRLIMETGGDTGPFGRLEWDPQKSRIRVPSGLYYAEVTAGDERRIFKVLIP